MGASEREDRLDPSGDEAGTAHLVEAAYGQLREMALGVLSGQARKHTLQATALVHEAYLKLAARPGLDWADRGHFLAVSALAMRSVLADHARSHRAAKRGGGQRPQTLVTGAVALSAPGVDVIALDDALRKLGEIDARQARIVEYRFLAGMTIEETADALHVSPRTVSDDWAMARAWLSAELSEGEPQ